MKKEKSQSTLSQLKADKTTQQYLEILSWWNKIQNSRLNLSLLPKQTETDFIEKRQTYKELNIERINKMNANINTSITRQKEAINALPPRLSFICKISKQQKWKNDLSSTIHKTFNNLNYNINNINNININKLKHKEKHQIETLENELRNNNKLYKFSSLPLEYFPPLYDPNNISTQPSYVKSYIDYKWTPGYNYNIMSKQLETQLENDNENNYNIYGKDYSQVQLSKIIKMDTIGGSSNTIGGTQDLQKKLQAEEEANLTNQQKLEKERGKKTAEARAENSLRLEKIRQTKEKIKQSVKDWDIQIKKRNLNEQKNKDNKFDDDNDNDNDNENNDKNKQTLKRIEEIELLNKDLPNIEKLLVDKNLNKEFFEKTLPLVLNNEFIDDKKYNECVLLLRKYYTLQNHVGYK